MTIRWLKRVVLLWVLCGALYGARAMTLTNSLTFGEKVEALAILMVTWPVGVYYELFPAQLLKHSS